MIGKMDIDRFKTIFSCILNKRIVPFVEEHVLEILDNKNFTGYYKNETIGDQTFIRPIFGLEIFDLLGRFFPTQLCHDKSFPEWSA